MAPERTQVQAGSQGSDGDRSPSPVDASPLDELLLRRLPSRLTQTNLSNLRFVEDYVLEAERLVRELKAALVSMRESSGPDHVDALQAAFEAAWQSELSVDERAADRAFFDDLSVEEPSRSWILADT